MCYETFLLSHCQLYYAFVVILSEEKDLKCSKLTGICQIFFPPHMENGIFQRYL